MDELQNNLEKEKFDTKLTDDQIINQVEEWEKESEDFYSKLKRVWEINTEYYKGNQTEVNKIFGRESRAVENRIWMATETMIPIATSRLPDIQAISPATNEVAQMNAQALQDVLQFHMERVQIQEKAERFLRDILVKRYGVFKVFWNKEIDDVDLYVINPKRIRVPKYGTSVYDLKFVIEDLELSYETAVEYFGKSKADELLKIRPQDSDNKKRKRTFSIKEVWTNDFVAWVAGKIILKKQENPYFDFEDSTKNYFQFPCKPYIIKSLFHTDESIIGDIDYIQATIPIQDNINIRKRQIENITNKVANPMLCIDSGVMSEEEAANITNEAGFILYGNGAADGTKVRFEAPGNIPNYLFEDLQFSRNEFDNIWGIHSTTRGERQPGRETATGRQLLRQADLGRIDLVARQLERALNDIAEWFTQLIKMFYTEEKTFAILSDEGTRFIKSFSGDKVGEIRLIVKPGSTLPKDEVTIHEEAKALWQLGAIGVKTLYKMLKLPNIQEAMEDFIATKTGNVQGRETSQPPM